MATKTQIGAVIGIEGYKEYIANLKEISRQTKLLASDLSLIDEKFKKQTKTVADLAKQKVTLQGEIAKVGNRLAEQRAKLEAVSDAYKKGGENADLLKQDMERLATECNKTEQELYQLENALNDLPADSFIGKLDLIRENLAKDQSEMKRWGELLQSIGETMTKYVTLPIVTAGIASTKMYADTESAFTGVKKTVDATTKSYDELESELWDIALNSASTFEQVAAAAEVAGQLGVDDQHLKEFTETMIRLGDSTNLTADEAATAFARIFNITGESLDNVEKVGNAVVWLGNNFATSESEITAMANRLAAGGTIAGLTTQEILGLATAMSSVGITAEAGGTSMTQTLSKIETEVAAFTQGTENNLTQIAEISGMSAETFAEVWETKPIEAVKAFITGLGNLDEEGESTTIILDELGMAGIRQSNMLKSLALASDVLTEAVDGSNWAYEESTALMDESNNVYSTLDANVNQLKESFKLLGSTVGETLGEALKPILDDLTEGIKNLAEWWKTLNPETQKMILIIAGLVAAIGPVLSIIGTVLTTLSSISIIATTLGVSLGALLAPIAGIVAAIVGVIAIGALLITHWEEIKTFFAGFVEGIKLGFESMKEKVSEVVENVKTFITNVVDFIVTGLVSLTERIVAGFLLFVGVTLPNFVKGVVDGFRNMVNNVKTTISNTVNSIKDTFNSLVSSAWNWGKDLIGNIISGIKSKVSSLVDSVKNVANTIWSYLHFSEPEVGALSDFHTWMPDMMKGLAKGIDDNVYLVDNAISRVADSLTSPNQVNYGGVVINLNIPQGANGQQIVDEIENELANRTIRRRAVFG